MNAYLRPALPSQPINAFAALGRSKGAPPMSGQLPPELAEQYAVPPLYAPQMQTGGNQQAFPEAGGHMPPVQQYATGGNQPPVAGLEGYGLPRTRYRPNSSNGYSQGALPANRLYRSMF